MLLPTRGGALNGVTKNGCVADYTRPKHFNNLSPKSDQYQVSPNNITTQSSE